MSGNIEISNAITEEDDGAMPRTLGDIWIDMPEEHRGFVIPQGWTPTPNGWSYCGKTTLPQRFYVSGRIQEMETGLVSLVVRWYDRNKWVERIEIRDTFSTVSKIAELSKYGLSVNQSNGADYIDFIEVFESDNKHVISDRIATNQQGWMCCDGKKMFMFGKRIICPAQSGDPQVTHNYCVQPKEGEANVINALDSAGNITGWQQVFDYVYEYPAVVFCIVASCATPMLEILNMPGIWVSLAGETSGGKTTALRIAASVWGQTDSSVSCSIVQGWHSTPVSIERIASIMRHIPIYIDDTSSAYSTDAIPSILYFTTSGKGKNRGTVDGFSASSSWRSIFFSTGEKSLCDYSKQNGTNARVIEMRGKPFGSGNSAANNINKAIRIIQDNYGLIGPAFIQWLIENESNWHSYSQRLDSLTDDVCRDMQESGSIHGRKAKHIAVFLLASELLLEAGLVPSSLSPKSAIMDSWSQSISDMRTESDRPREALSHLLGQVHADKSSYYSNDVLAEPYGGWKGIWHGSSSFGQYRGVLLQYASKLLRDQGYELTEYRQIWRDRGWIICNSGKTTLKARMPSGGVSNLIAVRIEKIEEII